MLFSAVAVATTIPFGNTKSTVPFWLNKTLSLAGAEIAASVILPPSVAMEGAIGERVSVEATTVVVVETGGPKLLSPE